MRLIELIRRKYQYKYIGALKPEIASSRFTLSLFVKLNSRDNTLYYQELNTETKTINDLEIHTPIDVKYIVSVNEEIIVEVGSDAVFSYVCNGRKDSPPECYAGTKYTLKEKIKPLLLREDLNKYSKEQIENFLNKF